MAKRSRLTARPGQRKPLQRASRSDRETRTPDQVSTAEEARAAELEAAILAEEKAATEMRRGRPRVAAESGAPALSTSTPLAVRAADEYAYVKRDVKRIVVVGGFLIAILAVLEVLVNGMHLFSL